MPLPFALLLLAYTLAAIAGLQWATVSGAASPIWPAAGIAVAGLLLGGRRLWPAIAIGAVVAFQLTGAAHPWWSQLLIGGGNALAAFAAATLIRRFEQRELALATVRDVLMLLAAAVLGATLSAVAGAGTLLLADEVVLSAVPAVLTTWFFGDAVGVLTIGALVFSDHEAERRELRIGTLAHLAAALLVLLAVAVAVFFGQPAARAWLVYPVLVWLAMRFRVRGTAVGLLLLFAVAGAGTILGHGPFAPRGAASADLVLLQQFLAVTSVTALLLAVAVNERDSESELRKAVADRLAAREELQRTTSLLNQIGETLPSLIYAKDREGRFIYVNGAVERLYGSAPGGLLGRTDADFATAEDAAQLRANDRRIMASPNPVELEEQLVLDGETRQFLSAKAPLRDEEGKVLGIIGISTDVTERHDTQAELAHLAQRARTAQRAARASSYEVDLATGLITRDPLIAILCGLEPGGIAPDQEGWVKHVHPDDRSALRSTMASAVEGFERYAMEYRVITADGSQLWLADTGEILRGEDGTAQRVVGMVMDVTERKTAEERERLLAREVDHRAKNLLAVVQSVVQMARADDAEALKSGITGRIQSLARAHSLLAEARWQGVALAQLAHEELAPYRDDQARRIEVAGPDLLLKPAAAQSMALVLHELATNAAKYGALSRPGGRVEFGWAEADGAGLVALRWREIGGPPGPTSERSGFGSRLIRASIERQMRARLDYRWQPEGLCVDMSIPAENLTIPRPAATG